MSVARKERVSAERRERCSEEKNGQRNAPPSFQQRGYEDLSPLGSTSLRQTHSARLSRKLSPLGSAARLTVKIAPSPLRATPAHRTCMYFSFRAHFMLSQASQTHKHLISDQVHPRPSSTLLIFTLRPYPAAPYSTYLSFLPESFQPPHGFVDIPFPLSPLLLLIRGAVERKRHWTGRGEEA